MSKQQNTPPEMPSAKPKVGDSPPNENSQTKEQLSKSATEYETELAALNAKLAAAEQSAADAHRAAKMVRSEAEANSRLDPEPVIETVPHSYRLYVKKPFRIGLDDFHARAQVAELAIKGLSLNQLVDYYRNGFLTDIDPNAA